MSEASVKVMVVEDDQSARQLTCRLLEGAGYTPLQAADGAEALATLRGAGERPAVVLLDLGLPVLDGWEVLEACCHDPGLAEVPVVVLSGAGDAETSLSLGADAVLRKPVNPRELIRTVDRLSGAAPAE